MTTEQLEKIIDRYLAGMASPEEKSLLQQWFDKTADHPVHLLPKKQQRISREIWQRIQQPDMSSRISNRSLLKYAAAVLVLAVATMTFVFIFPTHHTLAYEQVMTAPGKIKTVLLPDSSRIHLFPNSKIAIPENYGPANRTVLLEGKAFFDIHGNPEKLFTVQANKLLTTVLGTTFEVNAFPAAAQMTVTVTTGKVSVAYEGHLLGQVSPDQQLSYHTATAHTETRPIDANTTCNWISGRLIFQQTPLKEACGKLSEWFHVNIIIDNPERMKELVTVGFRGESLEKILTILSQTTGFTYTIDHDNIHIR